MWLRCRLLNTDRLGHTARILQPPQQPLQRPVFGVLGRGGLPEGAAQAAAIVPGTHLDDPLAGIGMGQSCPKQHGRGGR